MTQGKHTSLMVNALFLLLNLLLNCTKPDPTARKPVPQAADAEAGKDSVIFAAFGDAGTGLPPQFKVAEALDMVCQVESCQFVIGLGNNFYESGIHSSADPQFQMKFEKPYQNIDLPFYMTIGNHDAQGERDYQIQYSRRSKKWRMPNNYYSFRARGLDTNVHFIALDTTDLGELQNSWLRAEHQQKSLGWKIAFGHQPFRSNGEHGDANAAFQEFFSERLCGQIDIYLAGHDHHKEHLEETCGVDLYVIGTGAKINPVTPGQNTRFAISSLGFAIFHIKGAELVVDFYNESGEKEYHYEGTKTRPST